MNYQPDKQAEALVAAFVFAVAGVVCLIYIVVPVLIGIWRRPRSR